MTTKEYSKMAILEQSMIQKADKGIFVVDKDYNLNKTSLVIPKGMTIDLRGGSINNGTLVLNDTLLENMNKGCINARVEGTIRNSVIYTSTIGGINNLGLSDYSGMTIYCDQDESNVTTPIVISEANVNADTSTVFDGMNNDFSCASNFFILQYSSRNVTIKNFHATAQHSAGYIEFERMNSSANVTNIIVRDNTITGFSLGMSINGGAAAEYVVRDCLVTNNSIYNAIGTTSGHGYGIHLANAKDCTVSGNYISNCDRHAIYHAFGDGNTISGNTIFNHRSNYPIGECGVSYSAIDVARRSTNLTITGNSIINCYSIGILLSSHSPNREDGSPVVFPEKYGLMENIVISNNTIVSSGNTDATNGLPSVMIGTELPPPIIPEDINTYYVKNVEIKNNHFIRSNTEMQKCIRVVQCKSVDVTGNSFQFNALTTGHSRALIEFYSQFASLMPMTSFVSDNIFTPLNDIYDYNIYCISFLNEVNNSLFDITVMGNTINNQYSGGHQNYKVYQPIGITSIAGPNLHLQAGT